MFRILFTAFVACLLGLSLQSFKPLPVEEAPAKVMGLKSWHAPMVAQAYAVGGYVRTNYRLDTITNTEKDTFGLVSRNSTTAANALASYTPFLSLYTLDLTINRINISGTTSVKLYLDKSATTTPTAAGWMLVDSTSTTSGVGQIRIVELTGEIYRLRVVGTGTQSSSYKVNGLLKKLN